MMKISILGASGFIGKNLLANLSEFYDVRPVSLRKENWIKDMSDADVLINLVGKAHDHKGTATEKDYYFANVDLVKQIFSAFLKSDAKLLIHISSVAAVEEFGSDKPLQENDPSNPVSLYGKTKREAEEWLVQQGLPDQKRLIILRPPMVHGPGDKGNLGLLYRMVSKGIPYPLAAFDNERSFISIDNFAFLISRIIENYEHLNSDIYHITDDEPVSTKNIIEIIGRSEGKKIRLLPVPKSLIIFAARMGDVLKLPLNTKRLKKMTSNLIVSNQKIKTALKIENLPLSAEEGLIKTVKSFKSKR